jgi:hypothetical protein
MYINGIHAMNPSLHIGDRLGHFEARVGEAIRFGPEGSEAAIAARLRDEVVRLLGGEETSWRASGSAAFGAISLAV